MSLQSCKSPNFKKIGTPETKWHLDVIPVVNHREYYKGEGGGFPSSLNHGESCESCESMYAHGESVHQKCSNYTLANLLFGLCRSVWIINSFVTCLSLHLEAPTCPSTPEMLWGKQCTSTIFHSIVFTLRLAIESIKEFGGASCNHLLKKHEHCFRFFFEWGCTLRYSVRPF
jgi:hypothetical protein